jgi:hypothetical protein
MSGLPWTLRTRLATGEDSLMSQKPSTLEYAKADALSKPCLKWWPSGTAVVLIFGSTLTMCPCQYFDWISLPFTFSALGFACYGRICNRHADLTTRILLLLLLVLTALLLLKNVGDVLWFGHDAIWGRL